MSKVNRAPDLFAEIRDLQKRIRILENANRLTSASIKSGELKVYDSTGEEALRVGDFTYGAQPAHGLSSYRPDGSLIMGVGKFDAATTSMVLNDQEGNTVFALDEGGEGGLARPYIPMAFYPANSAGLWPTTSTAGFVALWRAEFVVWQTRAVIAFVAQTSGTAVGQAQVFITSGAGSPVAWGSPVSITSTSPSVFSVVGVVLPSVTTDCVVQIAAQVTSGTGVIGLCPLIGQTQGVTA